MSWVSNTFNSSIGRKLVMALSGFFLLIFLAQHFTINMLSVINPDSFNSVSHFMGTNPLIQFVLQPILIFGVIIHLIMGIRLELNNKNSRPTGYAVVNTNSSWMSRNMIITGLVILAFLGLHFYDFWIHEIMLKYVEQDTSGLNEAGSFRYYDELKLKFVDPIRVLIYCISFVLLSLHLMHGFQSAFQTVGANHVKYTPFIKKLGTIYAIVIPAGFIFIALFHFVSSL